MGIRGVQRGARENRGIGTRGGQRGARGNRGVGTRTGQRRESARSVEQNELPQQQNDLPQQQNDLIQADLMSENNTNNAVPGPMGQPYPP